VSEQTDESQRQCPACRNWVSFLATRCHFCGETLGRPRKEEVRKTIQDLGGESQSQYTVSGNVLDALEAFREENLSEAEGIRRQKEEHSQTWFGRKNESDGHGAQRPDMPELQGDHKSLADEILGGNEPAIKRHTPKPARYDSDMIRNVGIGIAVLIVAVVGYLFVYPQVQAYIAERNKPVVPVYSNLTQQKMDTGAPPLDVLTEAQKAVDVEATPENLALQEEARVYLEKAVMAMLNTPTFDEVKLSEASSLMNQALQVDHSERVKMLAEEVTKEVTAHKFILINVDAASNKATFKLNNPGSGQDEVQLGAGELLLDRFIVTAVTTTSVRLEDTKRQVHGRQRPLVSRSFQSVSGN
jgi:hypothetical protein